MKKIILLCFAILTILCLTACKKDIPKGDEDAPRKVEIESATQFVPEMTYEIVLPPDTFD